MIRYKLPISTAHPSLGLLPALAFISNTYTQMRSKIVSGPC